MASLVELNKGDIVTAEVDGWREGRVIGEVCVGYVITSEKKYDPTVDEFYLELVIS